MIPCLTLVETKILDFKGNNGNIGCGPDGQMLIQNMCLPYKLHMFSPKQGKIKQSWVRGVPPPLKPFHKHCLSRFTSAGEIDLQESGKIYR